jgi:hypothetical protein
MKSLTPLVFPSIILLYFTLFITSVLPSIGSNKNYEKGSFALNGMNAYALVGVQN